MKFLKSFFSRITDDLKQKKLIPLKILFFVHASTLYVLYPYLTIHMRELGINVEETAIMSAVTPVVSIVMPPLAGMLADKIGNFRLLLALSSVLGGLSALLLLVVPVGRLEVTFPPAADVLAGCNAGSLHLQSLDDFSCVPLHPYAYDVNISMHACGFVCKLPDNMTFPEASAISKSSSYEITVLYPAVQSHVIYRNTILNVIPQQPQIKDQSTTRIMKNNISYNTTIRKLPKKQMFFPAPNLYQMQCIVEGNNSTCMFEKAVSELDDDEVTQDATFAMRLTHEAKKGHSDLYKVDAVRLLMNGSMIEPDYGGVDNVMCTDAFAEGINGVGPAHVRVGGHKLQGCVAACVGSSPRKQICENLHQQIEIDPSLTFWIYLAVRVFNGIIGGTAFAMFEGAVIAILREQQADYGLQRVYGSIGGMISSPLSGMLIDYASRGKGYTDFRPAFYLYAVLKVVTGGLMLSINLEFKQPAQNLMEDVITVFRNAEIVALFIACFIMGTAWGYIESFLFWLLQDLGASRSLMGITITVGGIAGLPLLVLSGPIIRRLGHANVLFIGFIFYAIRLLGYSLIYNPWLCLVFEALESVTSSLSFTAAVTYAARLSSTTTDTSVQGLLGGLYYGVGKGSGSLIGGYLMKAFGTRPTYQIFAATTFFSGCIYFLFNKFYLRKRPQREANDICKKRPKVDIESCETKEKEVNGKLELYLDGASKKTPVIEDNKAAGEDSKLDTKADKKLSPDSVDGSSDSGVENPAYTEDAPAQDTTRSEHDKVTK